MKRSDTSPPTTNTTAEATPSGPPGPPAYDGQTFAVEPGTDFIGAGHDHQLDGNTQHDQHHQQPTASSPQTWSEQNRDLLQRVRNGSLSEDDLHELFDEMLDLPEQHLSLQLPLPKLLSPELEAMRYAIDDDDLDAVDEHLEPALKQVDKPLQRANLARAVLALTENKAIGPAIADVAIVDLDSHDTSSLLRTSLLHALSVSVGASPTPSGLLIVSR